MRKYINNSIELLDRNIPTGMSRRSFLKRFSGGLIIAVTLTDFEMLEAAIAQQYPTDLNAYLKVGEDGRITCYTGKCPGDPSSFLDLIND